MKNILIPIDFSINSDNALRYALSFFADAPVSFFLLHVVQKNDSEDCKGLFNKADEQLKKVIVTCKSHSINPAHQFYPIIEKGALITTIRKNVEYKDIDYMFLGTRGASKSNIEGIGSNAQEIVTKVKCPAIVIPEKAEGKQLKNIALPTDFNHWDHQHMAAILYETLLIKKANLHILQLENKNQNLTPFQEENKDFIKDFLKSTNYTYDYLESDCLDEELQQIIERFDIDMIAIVGKNLNLAQRLLFQPKNDSINYHLKTPFIILHK